MKTTVICIGDSITEGIGSSEPKTLSYPAQLGVLLGHEFEVCNCGRNGATLMPPENEYKDHYIEQPHFEKALEAAKNAKGELVVSIMLGTNDADVIDFGFRGRGEEYFQNYHEAFLKELFLIIDSFVEINKNVRLIIAKSPYSYDSVKHTDFGNLPAVWRFQQEAANICRQRGIAVEICDIAAATSPDAIGGEDGVLRYFRDRLHPNDVGYMYFSHFFYEAVKSIMK